MTIKRQISFTIEHTARYTRLRCTVTWNSIRYRFTLPYQITAEYWSKESGRCRPRTYHGSGKTPAAYINKELDETEIMLGGIFADFERDGTVPTKAEFAERHRALTNPDEKTASDLFDVYDIFVKDGMSSGRWGDGTLVKFKTIRRHLKRIDPNLTFEALEAMGINGLVSYFSNKTSDRFNEAGFTNRTVVKDINQIKTFIRWAQRNGYCDMGRFLSTQSSLRVAKRPVVFLEWDELMEVYTHDFGERTALACARDVFCFCCFTSLRYSDVANLKRANIHNGAIHITTVKTHDTLTIELNDYSKAILDRYKDVPFPDDAALPVITNQRMNDHLKEIGRLCGLDSPVTYTHYKGTKRYDKRYKKWELMSTHCGRRTFICNALMLGIPPDIVMKWTGHSDYKAMLPYIEIADKAKQKAMRLFDTAGGNK